ncbi:hypothetical protein M0R04_00800 [Candidatus Dojkabacteria bacterium]|jgi:hypothetical protein|nr:hypothetical protein [Candidatus Dojkabacteria bacterium]
MIKKIIFLFLIFSSFLFPKLVFSDFIPKNIDLRAVISDIDETEVLENTIELPDSMKIVIDLTNSSGFPDIVTRTVIQFDSNRFDVFDMGGGVASGNQIIFTIPQLLVNEDKHYEVILIPKTTLLPNKYKTNTYVSVSNQYGREMVELVSKIVVDADMEVTLSSNPTVDLNIDKPEIKYQIRARNIGSSIARNIRIELNATPFEGLGIIGNISNGGVFDKAKNLIIWRFPELNQFNELNLTFDFAITSLIENEANISTYVELAADYLNSTKVSNTSSTIFPKVFIPPDPIIIEKIVEVPVDRIVEVPIETIVEVPVDKIITKIQKEEVLKYITVPTTIIKEIKSKETAKGVPEVKGLTDEVIQKVEPKPKTYSRWILPLCLLLIILVSSILILRRRRE